MHHHWRQCLNIFQGLVHYYGRPANHKRTLGQRARLGHYGAVLGSQTGSECHFLA